MPEPVTEHGHQCLSVRELREQLGRRVDAAHYASEATIITKNGQPRAALISHEQYRDLVSRTDLADHTAPPEED